MGWDSSGVVGFDLGPLIQGPTRTTKLKSAYNSLVIGPRGFGALSLRWIQFASVLRCARSSFCVKLYVPEKLKSNAIYLFSFLSVTSSEAGASGDHYFSVSGLS